MRKSFLLLLFFGLMTPINAETSEKEEYPKYDFYSQCLDDALPKTLNNGLVYECSMKAIKKFNSLIEERINSKGTCYSYIPESRACSLQRSQTAFKTYVESECNWNSYGYMYSYCEMMIKKDRLKWLDKMLGTKSKNN